MSATERLRELLDERGVEWWDSSDENALHTTWNDMNCWFNEFPDGWTAWGMAKRGTPEQAIAATLGRATTSAVNGRGECQRVLYKPTGVLVCSECGAGIPKQLDKYCYLHFCPNCGRKVVDA